MNSTSVNITVKRAAFLASQTILWIQEQRKQALTEAYQEICRQDTRRWWERLIRRPKKYRSLEEALEFIKRQEVGFFSRYTYITCLYSKAFVLANQVLQLAELSSDGFVRISREDLDILLRRSY